MPDTGQDSAVEGILSLQGTAGGGMEQRCFIIVLGKILVQSLSSRLATLVSESHFRKTESQWQRAEIAPSGEVLSKAFLSFLSASGFGADKTPIGAAARPAKPKCSFINKFQP